MKEPCCCTYNKMIECAADFRPCFKCGWNPEVRKKRLEKVGIQSPKVAGVKV